MFCISGVDVASGECHLSYGGVEVFVLEFADLSAIHGVGPVGTEAFHVKFMGSLTDFFVGIECDADGAVLDLGMLLEIGYGRDYFSDAGFVVGSEEGVAVGNDE